MSGFQGKSPQQQQASKLLSTLQGGGGGAGVASGGGGGNDKRPRHRGGKNRGGGGGGAGAGAAPEAKIEANQEVVPSAAAASVDGPSESHLTTHEFSSLNVNPNTKRALSEVLKYRYMSKVQHLSIPECLTGKDALVKAKTGTGKTLSFLIPAIDALLAAKQQPVPVGQQAPRLLVLSPTRELASQIQAEAKLLSTFHRIGVLLFVGGTNMNSDVRNINKPSDGYSDILVATPGRLVAHINETPGFATQMMGVRIFVLDEADRLLDMGFEKDLAQINNCLNKRPTSLPARQTLLFSATVSKEVQKIANAALRKGHCYVDCVGEEGEEEQTHAHVPQHVMTVPMANMLRASVHAIEQHIAANPKDYKIIVFLGTARETQYYANLIGQLGLDCLEIHSRLSQSKRTKCSDEFRKKKQVILFSSDVSARGMDYPDVSFVLQIGSTTQEQYIHRLGRTARAGKSGTGMLLLSDFESSYMIRKELKEMPLVHIQPSAELLDANSDFTPRMRRLREVLGELYSMDASGGQHGEDSFVDQARMAWAAWLGSTNSMLRKLNMDKNDLVALSNHYYASIGLSCMPALQAKTVGKMGLKGVPGLRIEKVPQPQGGGSGGGRGGGGGGGGGRGGSGGANLQQAQQAMAQKQQQQQQQPQQQQSSQKRGGDSGAGAGNAGGNNSDGAKRHRGGRGGRGGQR